MALKKPFFIDLDLMLAGTWEGQETADEEGHVWPIIIPMGLGGAVRKVRYKNLGIAVDVKNIWSPPSILTVPHAEQDSKVIFQGGPNSAFGSQVHVKQMERVKQLENEVKDLRIQNARLRQVAEDASGGAEQMMARLKNLTKTRSDDSRATPSGHPLDRLQRMEEDF